MKRDKRHFSQQQPRSGDFLPITGLSEINSGRNLQRCRVNNRPANSKNPGAIHDATDRELNSSPDEPERSLGAATRRKRRIPFGASRNGTEPLYESGIAETGMAI